MAYNKKAHLRDNIEAIRLMFRLEKEQRTATPEEAGILAPGSEASRRFFPLSGNSPTYSAGHRPTVNCSPWLRNFTTSCMTEPLTNVNTNGWWKA